ncbi:hypothetical protein N836_31430 [Leptolyngbya sp. Heron Island J]|uniref:hypothetical protein n=1 Tax=Leptolyngbya sp. Heron Island J TaxID=1385935 RepID=UPI0003B97433|nr:hypothetical protein [Leptolyngbya sp. Heron Island J]ESA38454.1 hypothetical protein N836_31430 [Leptolyngbya sp. Heron Island J]
MILKGKNIDLLIDALQVAEELAHQSGVPNLSSEYQQLLDGIESLGQVSAIKLSDSEVKTCVDALAIALDVDDEMFYPLFEYIESNISPHQTRSAQPTEFRGKFPEGFISVQRGDQTILLRSHQLQAGDVVSFNRRLMWVKGWDTTKKSWELEPVSLEDIQYENPIVNAGATVLKRLAKWGMK